MKLEERQSIEIDFWKVSPTEKPEADSVENIVNKMTEAPILLDCLRRYHAVFMNAPRILELGGGQGWAACILKKLYPKSAVIITDISPWAIASVPKWEHIFNVQLDKKVACKSYEIPEESASVDCILCFAAAHHFAAHRSTLKEIQRVLVPGGNCFYFYEPSCPPYLYRMARWRVNRKRPEVPEDVLIYKKIIVLAQEAGLEASFEFYPSLVKRGPVETVYYMLMNKLPFLQRFFPCTANYHFKKPI